MLKENFNFINHLLINDFIKIDSVIKQTLRFDIIIINKLGFHILKESGKRIRSLILLLFLYIYNNGNNNKYILAIIIEFIHVATLLHDDVIDFSQKRRGLHSVNSVWGNKRAILMGDFLYSRSFQLMMKIKNLKMLKIVSNGTNKIAEGELLQLNMEKKIEFLELNYFNMILNKTAKLFEISVQLGVILGNIKKKIFSSISTFGYHFGIAFQLMNDVHDYIYLKNKLGKLPGSDLLFRKPTLPLINLYQNSSVINKNLIKFFFCKNKYDDYKKIYTIILESNTIEHTLNIAKKEIILARKELRFVKNSIFLDAIINLSNFVLKTNLK